MVYLQEINVTAGKVPTLTPVCAMLFRGSCSMDFMIRKTNSCTKRSCTTRNRKQISSTNSVLQEYKATVDTEVKD